MLLPRVGAADTTRLFVGPVLVAQTGKPPLTQFVMRGGGSRKYARVRVVCDVKTQWSGIDFKGKRVKVGDPVRVTAVPARDGAFRAVTLTKLDPHEKPLLGAPSKSP
jgi:hypothetical protein